MWHGHAKIRALWCLSTEGNGFGDEHPVRGTICSLGYLVCTVPSIWELVESRHWCLWPNLTQVHEQESGLRKSMLNAASTVNGCSVTVDKSKTKGSSRSQQQTHTNGQPDLVPPETKPRGLEYYKALCEKKNQTIQQLKNSFIAGNRRFEAISVVVQTLYKQVCSFPFVLSIILSYTDGFIHHLDMKPLWRLQ